MNHLNNLAQRFKTKQGIVGVYGLGYVGLPLALRFSEVGVRVLGFDIDPVKVGLLNDGRSYIERISAGQIEHARQQGFSATCDFSRTAELDAIIICVPTPLNAHREPDLSFVSNTLAAMLPYLKEHQLISLESTTWPGTTEEIIAPHCKAVTWSPAKMLHWYIRQSEKTLETRSTALKTFPKSSAA